MSLTKTFRKYKFKFYLYFLKVYNYLLKLFKNIYFNIIIQMSKYSLVINYETLDELTVYNNL